MPLALVPAATGAAAADTGPGQPTPTTSAGTGEEDFSGLVDIGGGRKICAVCKGSGSPTVVLIAGKGNGADDWRSILDPDDPVHDAPGDDLPWRDEGIHRSDDSVFSQVSRFTRVCTYDRPDVRVTGADVPTRSRTPSTPTWTISARCSPPSAGRAPMCPWRTRTAAPAPRDVPAVVLSADKPWRVDLLPSEARKGEQVTFEDWLASQQRLSAALCAREHITNTHSGHDLYLNRPRLVVDAICDVVKASS